MTGSSSSRITKTEVLRWLRDTPTLITMAALIVLSGVLTYLAVAVASGDSSGGGSGFQVQTDTTLTQASTNEDILSMVRSSLTMLVPIAAIVIGIQFAGGELASGALLQIGVAARRLRYLFAVRLVMLSLLAGFAAAAAAAITIIAASVAVSNSSQLNHLTPWDDGWRAIVGSSVQAVIIACIAFALSALTRRWIVIAISMLVYMIALEPIIAGLVGDQDVWLPRTATSELMLPAPDLAHILPTALCAVIFSLIAIMALRRDRVAR